jgi:prolyl 4-hydroxylase
MTAGLPKLELVRHASNAGDVAAMFQLGLRLLIGNEAPFEPKEALGLLERAMSLGDAAATAQMATLAANGAWMPKDVPLALEWLQTAATLGSASARGQLKLLASRDAVDAEAGSGFDAPGCWERLRISIDLAAWHAMPPRQPVCEAPRIRLSERFVTADICRWLIERAREKLKPAMMFDGKKARFEASRNNSDYCFDIVEADVILALIRERVSAVTKLPIAMMEPPQVFHYAEGQEIKAHYDHVRAEGGYQAERIATFILYLNDDYEGGELEFPKAGFRHRGRAGDGIYFANVDQNNAPDMLTLHAALPVSRGEKFVLSQWIQDQPFGTASV